MTYGVSFVKPMAKKAPTETRVPLNRERVLRAAIVLADEGGIEALSMRKLAQRLGVEAMSLYNHVANKDEILNGMVDLVVQEMDVAPDGDDWKAVLREIAVSAHQVLLRHRWACSLIMSSGVSQAKLQQMESMLSALRQAGCSADLTHHAYHALESHIVGFTLWQVSLRLPASHEELARLGREFLRELPQEDFPHLTEHIVQHLDPNDDHSGAFEFGLDLILDGVERLRDAGAART